MFLLHPTLFRTGLGIFQCVEVSDNDNRARADLSIKWYSNTHILWSALLGIPNVVIWGIGIPVTALVLLIKYKNKLEQWEVQRYLLMLYQGLNKNRFYWELVNTLRKSLLLSISVFLSTVSLQYRALAATFLMIVFSRLQNKLSPYKLKENNRLESYEILTGSLTIFSSMVFEDEQNSVTAINMIIFILGNLASHILNNTFV